MDSLTTTSPATILIVEDEEGPRESLKMVLSPYYNLYAVNTAEMAHQLLSEHHIDLITLDLKLPGKQGLAFLHELRQSDKDVDVVIITGTATLESAIEAIHHGVAGYIQKPFEVCDLLAVIQKAIERRRYLAVLRHSLTAFGSLWSTESDREATIHKLATVLEAQNPQLAQHAKRVEEYAAILVEHLHLARSLREAITLGAFLHDVGKIGLQERVALGSSNPPNQDELVKCHPVIGERMLQTLPFPPETLMVIRHHHERYDGTGFPDGLAGETIPYPARIVSVANIFDNLVTGQHSSQPPLSVPDARERIRRDAGRALDPTLAELFARVIG
ncbi:MAG: response regulator [Nitrospirae bacterium]|nr:MAG: response regulator [Nitrospirota bacterium]